MKQTPMLQQYLQLKAEHPDALLLYRLGDFYELFFEDAEAAAPVLGIVLTRRRHNDEVSSAMCGIPHHSLAGHVGKLLDAGFRVAVAEQMEEPSKASGLVRRAVVRVLTPATVTEPELLGDGGRRWLAAVLGPPDAPAVAFLEPASGEFAGATCATAQQSHDLLAQLAPREVLLPAGDGRAALDGLDTLITERPATAFEVRRGDELLRGALGVGSLRAFELDAAEPLVGAAGALLDYLKATQGEVPRHLRCFRRLRLGSELVLDAAAVRNLELVRSTTGERAGCLAAVLDHTVTAMGSRLLRDWLVRPLGEHAPAEERHEAVQALIEDPNRLNAVRELLRRPGDLERLASRLGFRQVRPGELAALRAALPALRPLAEELADAPSRLLSTLAAEIDPLEDLQSDLGATLADEPPALLAVGTIREGCDQGLDEVRRLSRSAKEVLGELEARERERSGVGNLRIRYNRVFGYGFEVSRGVADRVPDDWVRRQTLTNAERFVTPELEDLERRITGAEAASWEREQELWDALVSRCAEKAARLAATARAVAAADVLSGFADRAREQRYVRPRLVPGATLRLVGSRHPVVEESLRASFVPNDLELDGGTRQIVLMTGPNMGGKSTFLRQAALAVIMARAGSFVAAEEAEIGEIDRVFTRIGAADDLSRGQSTFMVEMTEVAAILRQATGRSLVILDEVGRGTATFDGLSLAWAVVEALHERGDADGGPLVLFATHYHELTDLADRLPRVANASVAVKEWQGQVLFLHRVTPGPSDRSYGIHVARLAGVPEAVCRRAGRVLRTLERQELKVLEQESPRGAHQMRLFPGAEEVVVRRLRALEPEKLTPLEALNLLAELKREADDA